MKAVVYTDMDEFENGPPGSIVYCKGSALIKCPGCGTISSCSERTGDNHPSWAMDKVEGSWQPSVHHLHGCGWHGFLTKGEWKPV